ncbi:hypothetical protein, partial [Enhygromyxa salina]|uniref:hypothetical protein n=1 Tax=Enhygromyxa salina TaxID=215803 RepID=UPI0011B26586
MTAVILCVVTIGMPGMTHASEQLAPRLVGRMMVAPEPGPARARAGLQVETGDLGSAGEPLKAK